MKHILTIFRWVIALILCSWGLFMLVGFLAEKFDGGSKDPIWFDLLFVTLVGLVPLGGGLMLICADRLGPTRPKKADEHAV